MCVYITPSSTCGRSPGGKGVEFSVFPSLPFLEAEKTSVQILSVGNNHFLILTMYLRNGHPSVDSTESRLRGPADEEHTFETHDRTLRILTLPFLGIFFQVFGQVGWFFPVLMHENEIELVTNHSESQSMHAIHSRKLIILINVFTY